jgi:hypothetical protein
MRTSRQWFRWDIWQQRLPIEQEHTIDIPCEIVQDEQLPSAHPHTTNPMRFTPQVAVTPTHQHYPQACHLAKDLREQEFASPMDLMEALSKWGEANAIPLRTSQHAGNILVQDANGIILRIHPNA